MQMYKKFTLTNNGYVHYINYCQWRIHWGAGETSIQNEYSQWRRNEFESAGGGPFRRKAPEKFFLSCLSNVLAQN